MDILEGTVALENVETIIASTTAANPQKWDELIERYKTSYWAETPEQAEKIVRQLLVEGRIVQPRLQQGLLWNIVHLVKKPIWKRLFFPLLKNGAVYIAVFGSHWSTLEGKPVQF